MSISLSNPVGAVSQFLSLIGNAGGAKKPPVAGGSGPDSSTEISSFGQLFSKLNNLAKTDQAKFKGVTSEISTKLTAAAQKTGGPEAQFLSSLAAQFSQASQTGNPSDLAPKKYHGVQDAKSILQNVLT